MDAFSLSTRGTTEGGISTATLGKISSGAGVAVLGPIVEFVLAIDRSASFEVEA